MAGTMNCSWILETDSTGKCSTQENNRQLQKFTVVGSHLAFLQLIYCKLCDTVFPWSNNGCHILILNKVLHNFLIPMQYQRHYRVEGCLHFCTGNLTMLHSCSP